MSLFEYVVKDLAGEELTGVESAVSSDAAVEALHRRGLIVLSLEERAGASSSDPFFKRFAAGITGMFNTVPVRELALFTRQLATMLHAGLPLVRALHSLSRDCKKGTLSVAVENVAVDLQNGLSFSEALERHPRIFNALFISMVRAGERSGKLDQVLDQVGEYLEKADAIQTKVKSAMAYPGFVFFFSVGAALFLLLKVVPTFAGIYKNFNSQLPAPTMFVLGISQWTSSHFVVMLVGGVVGGFAFNWWRGTPAGAFMLDGIMLRVPVLGDLALKAAMSRFTRTLSALLAAGLPMLEALELTEGACGNHVIAGAVRRARARISDGQELGEAFAAESVLPHMIVQLMSTGQETGAVDKMLARAANFCDLQVDAGVSALASLIEPVMIVTMGGLVGGLVVTMFLPVFNLGNAMGG